MPLLVDTRADQHGFSQAAEEFISDARALDSSFAYTTSSIDVAIAICEGRLKQHVEEYGEPSQDAGNRETGESDEDGDDRAYDSFIMPAIMKPATDVLDGESKDYITSRRLIPGMYLVALNSRFDEFLYSLGKTLLSSRPELLLKNSPKVEFKEISRLSTVAEVQDLVISRTVGNMLRESRSDQVKWFEERIAATLRTDKQLLSCIFEASERRNMIVHRGGVVTEDYVQNMRNLRVAMPESLDVGDELTVSAEYFQTVACAFRKAAALMSQICWRKVFKSESADADSVAIDAALRLITLNDIETARDLLSFIDRLTVKSRSDATKRVLALNIAQCHYKIGRKDLCEEVLSNIDWTAVDSLFLAAVCTLREEWVASIEHIREAHSGEKLSVNDILSWPIFAALRSTEEFRDFATSELDVDETHLANSTTKQSLGELLRSLSALTTQEVNELVARLTKNK